MYFFFVCLRVVAVAAPSDWRGRRGRGVSLFGNRGRAPTRRNVFVTQLLETLFSSSSSSSSFLDTYVDVYSGLS